MFRSEVKVLSTYDNSEATQAMLALSKNNIPARWTRPGYRWILGGHMTVRTYDVYVPKKYAEMAAIIVKMATFMVEWDEMEDEEVNNV